MRAVALTALLLLGGCVSDYPYQDPYGNYGNNGGYQQQPYSQQPYGQPYGYSDRDRRDRDDDRGRNDYGYGDQDRWQGPAKENFAACAGMPNDHQKNGEWEYWIYAPQRSGYGYGYDSRGYCEALVTIRKGRVLGIDYRDGRGRTLGPGAHCAPRLEACLR